MRTTLFAASTILFAVSLFADAPATGVSKTKTSVSASDLRDRAAIMDKIFAKKGGKILKPGTGVGCIGIIDAGSNVDEAQLNKVKDTVGQYLKVQQKVVKIEKMVGLPSRETIKRLGLDAAVFVVSDDSLPSLLTAPEECWSLVNVNKLKIGIKRDVAGNAIFNVRLRAELQRAYWYACGCGSSQYEGNIMNITDVSQLDTMNPDMVVGDSLMLSQKHLSRINVKPAYYLPYESAVKQGWAPAPTNDIQKAVWDKVHAIPTKPIKIEFDPKTDTK